MENSVYDTIIVGSGAGGLATAICLARAGQKVLVLEQHDVPGGWCHSFMLEGQRFTPGVHYIGLIEEGQSTNQLYRGLGIANDIIFFRMNPMAYEHCIVNNDRFDIPAGLDKFIENLSSRFPSESRNIKNYLRTVRNVNDQLQLISKMRTFLDHLTIVYRTRHMGKYGLFTLKRVIDWYIKDPLLKTILNVQCGDHGLAPAKASFAVHCAVMGHYFEGAGYPMGGGAGIVKAMTNAFKRHGGEIRTSTRVSRILTENQKVTGVELLDGSKIYANRVVSNADPTVTYFDLIGKEKISSRLRKKLEKIRYSVTSLILFLTLEMDVKKYGIDSGNIWQLNAPDLDGIYNQLTSRDLMEADEFPAVFISCTTLKDPTSFNGKYHNFEVVTFISYDTFSRFDTGEDYHSDAYMKLKERITGMMMNNLERVMPGVKSHVVHMELGTPKTNQFYINSTKGNVYGTEKTLNQVGPFSFSNKSEIENLYLCGANTLSHGVGGATYSGVVTASTILGCRPDELIVPDSDQHLRIYDAEDDSGWSDTIRQKVTDKQKRGKYQSA